MFKYLLSILVFFSAEFALAGKHKISVPGKPDVYVPTFESDGKSMIFKGRTGIGGTPYEQFSVRAPMTKTLSSSGWGLSVLDTRSDGAIGNGGAISFAALRSDGGQFNASAISGHKAASGMTETGDMIFYTATGGVLAEKMRLTYNGRLAVGTTSPSTLFHIKDTAPSIKLETDSNAQNAYIVYEAPSYQWTVGPNFGLSARYEIQNVANIGVYLANNGTSWSSLSDERFKKDITPITDNLSKVTQLNPVKFKWKSTSTDDVGFIAQEVKTVIPEVVDDDSSPNHYLGISRDKLIPYLVGAIKEQNQILMKQKAWICSQTNKPADLCD